MVCARESSGYGGENPGENRSAENHVMAGPNFSAVIVPGLAFMRNWRAAAAAGLLLVSCSGCERLFDKGSKQDIEAADAKVKAGDYQAAIKLYEASLDGSPRTADVHYKL